MNNKNKINFFNYNEAKNYIEKLNLKGETDWRLYCKSGKKPKNIPSSPNQIYKNKGWISWGDWFGTNRIAYNKHKYLLKKFKKHNNFFYKFDTEEKCIKFLTIVRWNKISKCPKCNNDYMNYYLNSRKTYKCSKCYNQFSVIKDTIFENSKISLVKWIKILYLYNYFKEISSVQMAHFLKMSQKTVWNSLEKIKKNNNDDFLNKILRTFYDNNVLDDFLKDNSTKYISYENLKIILKKFNIKTKKQYDEFRKNQQFSHTS